MIKDGSSVADSNTVVNGPHSALGAKDYLSHEHDFSIKELNDTRGSHTSKANIPSNFFTLPEHTLGDRPFFVFIGKDGLIAALQKLDLQLKNVRRSYVYVGPCSYMCRFRQSKRPHILSNKVND